MKKKCSVIEINGLSGIALIIFVLCCAITGFVAFPSWCCMHAWNFVAEYINCPTMNIWHGGMLWLILILTFVATHLGKLPVRFNSVTAMSKEEMKSAFEQFNAQSIARFTQDENEKESQSSNIKKEN